MEKIGNTTYYTLEEVTDQIIGPIGTPRRDAMEARVEKALDEYYLGQSIKDAREARHLTQEELGQLVGVQKAQISRIERGHSITFATIKKVFRALDMRVSLQTEVGAYPIA